MEMRSGVLKSILRSFVSVNIKASRVYDRLFSDRLSAQQSDTFPDIMPYIRPGMRIADLGGGKQPFLNGSFVRENDITYVGIDIDPEELANAPLGAYSYTRVLDVTSGFPPDEEPFDIIICKSTLEHVRDTRKALENLLSALKPGGHALIRTPCRHAVFAHLNRWLPEGLKRRLLHSIFPHKETDGFPAFYNRCSPPEFKAIISENGGRIFHLERCYWSSYFTAFFPVYAAWRFFSLLQLAFVSGYCENFAIIVGKNADAGSAPS
ncbi:class I SAM-dependent methyltransferase [Cribrihabitans pelagius]|uniref:class I SAM-dependent methyltransferase n=1 Tax=Cribrihabitans pelagius TaxID=1765746 RepID=UPI003B5BDB6B